MFGKRIIFYVGITNNKFQGMLHGQRHMLESLKMHQVKTGKQNVSKQRFWCSTKC